MRRILLGLVATLGCATASQRSGSAASRSTSAAVANAIGPSATAVIEPRSGSALTGSARFTAVEGGLAVHVEVQNAPPGLHGVASSTWSSRGSR
jgi:Cu/Zn superoxide dismutase